MMLTTGFLWILLACALYGAFHSLLASTAAKRFAKRIAGAAAYQRGYRLFYNLVGGLTLLPVLALARLTPDQALYTIPAPWVYATGLLQALAGLGLVIGVLQTGAFAFLGLAQAVGTPSSGQLVTGGLYRWVRHPLYAFGLVLLWLTPLMTWNLLAFAIGLTVYILIGIQLEERKLTAEFGAQYSEYARRTPMLVPGLKHGPS
jgi:protein-S-isoprenylcysteine O-methyltransferase Ste14